MSILRIDRTYHNIQRLRQVVTILVKYGLGELVSSLRIDYYLAWMKRLVTRHKPPKEVSSLTRPMRVRMAMEELGPTFVKLGQMLSTRQDVIPPAYIQELTRLLDEVAPVSVDEIKKRVESELKRPIKEIFSRFSEEPFASASIAQVHTASLVSGEDVVVKVVRPGIESVIRTDLDILAELAQLIEKHFPEAAVFEPVALIDEFSRSINKEVDLAREGRIMDRFAANFEGDETIHIPKVYWGYCSQKVLTQERLVGQKLSGIDFDELPTSVRKTIARNGAAIILKQILSYGLFHADPHPGNMFLLPGNRLGLVDYGIVGRTDPATRTMIAEVLVELSQGRPEKVADILLRNQPPIPSFDRGAFVRDTMELCDLYVGIPLKSVMVTSLFSDLVQTMQRHKIRFPKDLMLLSRALVTIEGVGRRLDPDFDMVEFAKPFVKKFIHERLGPAQIAKTAWETLRNYANLSKTLPKDVSAILSRLKESQMEIGFVHKGLENFSSRLEKVGYRLTLGMIISALIIGSSYLAAVEIHSNTSALFFYSVIGFLSAIVLAIILLISFRKS